MARRKNSAPDLEAILGKLAEAQALLECGYQILEDGDPGKEAVCFEIGIRMFGAAYRDLDKAITRLAAD